MMRQKFTVVENIIGFDENDFFSSYDFYTDTQNTKYVDNELYDFGQGLKQYTFERWTIGDATQLLNMVRSYTVANEVLSEKDRLALSKHCMCHACKHGRNWMNWFSFYPGPCPCCCGCLLSEFHYKDHVIKETRNNIKNQI